MVLDRDSKIEFLYLSEEDVIKAGIFDHANSIKVIEEVIQLVGNGDYIMGGKGHNDHGIKIYPLEESKFDNIPKEAPDRRFASLPAYIGGRFNVCGEKWYGSNIDNCKINLPRSVLMINITDPRTCLPIAYMSGNIISAIRTGAVAAVGAKYLAKSSSKTLCVIGCGLVNRAACATIFTEIKGIEKVYLNDINNCSAQEFSNWIKEKYNKETIVTNLKDAVSNADIISVAASQIEPVIIKENWIKSGTFMTVFGGLKVEDNYWVNSKNVFDNVSMHKALIEESKVAGTTEKDFDYLFAGQIYKLMEEEKHIRIEDSYNFPDIVCGKYIGRINDKERINLMTFGMGVYDVALGFDIYQKAVDLGLGTRLKLWEKPLNAKLF